MLETFSQDLLNVIGAAGHNMLFSLKLIGILWVIQIINWLTQYRLNAFGIYPRRASGLPGIIIAPFLHGNFSHLFLNSIPLLVLSSLIKLDGDIAFYYISAIIIFLSGLLTWAFGRQAIHIGASSVIMGYFGYLLTRSYFNFNATTLIVAVVCIYYFGGMLLSVFPTAVRKNVSWEGHIFGLASGVFMAYIAPMVFGS